MKFQTSDEIYHKSAAKVLRANRGWKTARKFYFKFVKEDQWIGRFVGKTEEYYDNHVIKLIQKTYYCFIPCLPFVIETVKSLEMGINTHQLKTIQE